ncbi:GAF domain-containing protein [Nocardioides plantarum]|uniref:GAF domain-containing protein n=1 Tax=Nocardioides plantarum TaxID=29299 RepID=A0ABV5K992_9ACTN|nr:GAF domain-containing protein [Nocardioides plantarum]
MPVYRAPMRSRRDDVDPTLATVRALRLGVVGIGGHLAVAPGSLAEALAATYDEHGERAAARLRRFAEVGAGAQVWTRDDDGLFRVGVLTGGWRYDVDDEAWAADLVHVRDCAWSAPADVVPAAVLATFARGGRNFQQVRALP